VSKLFTRHRNCPRQVRLPSTAVRWRWMAYT